MEDLLTSEVLVWGRVAVDAVEAKKKRASMTDDDIHAARSLFQVRVVRSEGLRNVAKLVVTNESKVKLPFLTVESTKFLSDQPIGSSFRPFLVTGGIAPGTSKEIYFASTVQLGGPVMTVAVADLPAGRLQSFPEFGEPVYPEMHAKNCSGVDMTAAIAALTRAGRLSTEDEVSPVLFLSKFTAYPDFIVTESGARVAEADPSAFIDSVGALLSCRDGVHKVVSVKRVDGTRLGDYEPAR
jgi:hypothetical protein